jgi:hypothetical protein
MEESNRINTLLREEFVIVESRTNISVQNVEVYQTHDSALLLEVGELVCPVEKTTVVLCLSSHSYTIVHNETFTTLKFPSESDVSVFHAIMQTCCTLRVQPMVTPSTSETIVKFHANVMETTHNIVTGGIKTTSELCSYGIKAY